LKDTPKKGHSKKRTLQKKDTPWKGNSLKWSRKTKKAHAKKTEIFHFYLALCILKAIEQKQSLKWFIGLILALKIRNKLQKMYFLSPLKFNL